MDAADGPVGFASLATAAALVLTAQLTGEPWKPCAFNDTTIDCRERHRDDQLQVEWRDGQAMTYTRLTETDGQPGALYRDRLGGLWRLELFPQGNRALTHTGNGNRLFLPLRPDRPQAADPLPSWREGPVRQALLRWLQRVTDPASPEWVPEPDRIAVFDNDGTLWPEHPLPFQLAFALDQLPEQERRQVLRIGRDRDNLQRLLARTHAGMTTTDFAVAVQRWLATARHPRFNRPYDQLAYQPMLELLDLLRRHGFSTWIVSGGGADFLRVWTERVYGIPPQQVVGTTTVTRFELRDARPVLVKTLEQLRVNDGAGKPAGIHAFIGRRPLAAFGNSDGDLAMLQYTTMGGERPTLGLIVHHTDATREYAYDARSSSSGRLEEALRQAPQQGWLVVDMARDWEVLFGPP
jgi:phosphoglycolate phosphatase-like HAD superfamily hydrolase